MGTAGSTTRRWERLTWMYRLSTMYTCGCGCGGDNTDRYRIVRVVRGVRAAAVEKCGEHENVINSADTSYSPDECSMSSPRAEGGSTNLVCEDTLRLAAGGEGAVSGGRDDEKGRTHV